MGVVAEGGYGTGVNPAGTHFPFISEVSGLQRLLADMYLGHRVDSVVLPLRISEIHNMTQPPSGSRADLVVVDADDNVVFDSTDSSDYRTYNFSARLKIHEWLTDEAVCRVVQHTGQNDSEDVIAYPSSQYPSDAILDERVSELWPKQVYKFKVNSQYVSGDVEFVGGYNFTTSLASVNRAAGNEHTSQVIVGAEGGTGEGFTPGCDEEDLANPPIKRINQVSPTDKGDFVITANECLSLANTGTTYLDGADKKILFDLDQLDKKGFILKNNCQPCCTCDDFVNTYKGIQRLYDVYAELGRRSAILRDKHGENIARWLAQKECREAAIVKLSVLPFNIREDSCAKVAVGICNSYQACRGEIELELEFETPSGLTGYINKETVYIYDAAGASAENYTLEGSWPNYKVRWPVIESQRLAKIKFDVVFSRAPVITWDSQFTFTDGPSGNVVLDGRLMVILESLSTKDKYSLLITTNKVDAAKTLAAGYRSEDILQKATQSGITVTSFKNGTFKTLDGYSWEVLTNPSSASVKPYSLRLKYDKTVNFTGKYSGRLYTDSIIPPTFGPKVTSSDYLTVNATALLNNVLIPYGTASTTVGLKVQ